MQERESEWDRAQLPLTERDDDVVFALCLVGGTPQVGMSCISDVLYRCSVCPCFPDVVLRREKRRGRKIQPLEKLVALQFFTITVKETLHLQNHWFK